MASLYTVRWGILGTPDYFPFQSDNLDTCILSSFQLPEESPKVSHDYLYVHNINVNVCFPQLLPRTS